jgi:cytochrome c-type biogenesis protein CcmH/NrfG
MAEGTVGNKPGASGTAAATWSATQVYAMAAVCLAIGLAVGYLFRGSKPAAAPAAPAQSANMSTPPAAMPGGHAITLEQMKQIADKKAEPVLAKLKDDPRNADLLIQAGTIYFSTHQFNEAASYFAKSLEVKPKNVAIRTQLASCLYYTGDVDGALKQLTQATVDDPHDANSLFNLGMIRWRGKNDSKGALAAWGQLLKSNPQLEPAKKAQVEKLIAEARGQNPPN